MSDVFVECPLCVGKGKVRDYERDGILLGLESQKMTMAEADAYRLAGVNEAIDKTRIECHKMFDETICEMQKDADIRVREALEGVYRKANIARNELAALVEDPDAPDFSSCLWNRNPADRKCLETAFEMLTRIVKQIPTKLSSGEVKING